MLSPMHATRILTVGLFVLVAVLGYLLMCADFTVSILSFPFISVHLLFACFLLVLKRQYPYILGTISIYKKLNILLSVIDYESKPDVLLSM
jgi:hypothetical protein